VKSAGAENIGEHSAGKSWWKKTMHDMKNGQVKRILTKKSSKNSAFVEEFCTRFALRIMY